MQNKCTNIFGNVTGNVSGTITGTDTGSTDKLASRTTFKVQGDVKYLTCSLMDNLQTLVKQVYKRNSNKHCLVFILQTKQQLTSNKFDDEFLITRVTDLDGNGTGVRKIRKK